MREEEQLIRDIEDGFRTLRGEGADGAEFMTGMERELLSGLSATLGALPEVLSPLDERLERRRAAYDLLREGAAAGPLADALAAEMYGGRAHGVSAETRAEAARLIDGRLRRHGRRGYGTFRTWARVVQAMAARAASLSAQVAGRYVKCPGMD